MGSSLACFSFIFFIIIFPCLGASQDDCRLQRCSKKSPAIKFPFRLKGRQPDYCGYPIHGFELSCNARKQTVIELPDAGQFFVRRIDYKSQELDLYASDSCLLNRFLHLNFSPSPFHYRGDYVYNRTFFSCSLSQETTYDWKLITCLSVPGYQVYEVYSKSDVSNLPLLSCIKLNTALVPNELLYSKSDVRLNWSAPTCGACEEHGKKYCRLKGRNGPETECYDIAKPEGSSTKRVITGATIGFFLLVVAVGTAVYCFCYSNKVERENQIKIERFLEDYKALKPTRYSYADMKRMTDQFKNKLGQGGYGTVFKGKLSNEILVAVKILNNSTGNGEEFINEVGTMSRIHHVNVVRLVGFCADGFKRAVVYEFQPNESLEKFIFSKDSKNPSLGWKKLQDIALGIAKGIEYLHQGCDQRILHFDIKPHNILLDHNFNPKISDFGLAKLCSKEQSAVSMTAARGTMGYIAPEVFSRNFGNVSYKSDVFSFGMMLLEMVGGRKNIDTTVENTSQVYFPEWIYNRLDQGEELGIQVNEEDDAKIAKKLTIVALWCIQWYPVDRPSMKVVVQMLEGDGESLDIPPNPFASMDQPTTSVAMAGRPFHNELTVISEAE